jgi:hypothetical protein
LWLLAMLSWLMCLFFFATTVEIATSAARLVVSFSLNTDYTPNESKCYYALQKLLLWKKRTHPLSIFLTSIDCCVSPNSCWLLCMFGKRPLWRPQSWNRQHWSPCHQRPCCWRCCHWSTVISGHAVGGPKVWGRWPSHLQ